MALKILFSSLEKILKIFNSEFPLLEIKNDQLITPTGNVFPVLTKHKSSLPNEKVDFARLKKLVTKLNANQSIVRLNHIGFCYKTDSQFQEKLRLINLTKQTKYHLYEEPSNDDGLWLFFGNSEQWGKPMVEFLPVEKVTQWIEWKEYWLPNLHIDIDMDLYANKTVSLVKEIFGKNFEPHLVIVEGITFIVRCRLGIIDGVNIFLDLATNARNVEFQRKNIWKQLV